MPAGNTATPENKPIGAFENQPDATSQRDGKTDVDQRSDADLASEQTANAEGVQLAADQGGRRAWAIAEQALEIATLVGLGPKRCAVLDRPPRRQEQHPRRSGIL